MARNALWSAPAFRRAASLLVGSALAISLSILPAGVANADTDVGNLPGGTSIAVTINTPADGSSVAPGDVTVTGEAQVGQGVAIAQTSLVMVVDVSGSTVIAASSGPGCGGDANGDGLANSVLDCEIAASQQLNAQAATLGTVGEIGIVLFADGAVTADMGPTAGDLLFTAPGTAVGAVLGSLFTDTAGGPAGAHLFTEKATNAGSTNFAAAITAAVSLLGSASEPNKMVAFLSDGEATTGGSIAGPLATVPAGVKFHTFAVGSASTCSGNPYGLGSLQDIATATGGTCRQVATAAALPNILPQVIASRLTSLEIKVDGGSYASLAATPSLPQTGPTTATFSTTVSLSTLGSHTICVRATGSDAGGTANAEDCHTFTIGEAGGPPGGGIPGEQVPNNPSPAGDHADENACDNPGAGRRPANVPPCR